MEVTVTLGRFILRLFKKKEPPPPELKPTNVHQALLASLISEVEDSTSKFYNTKFRSHRKEDTLKRLYTRVSDHRHALEDEEVKYYLSYLICLVSIIRGSKICFIDPKSRQTDSGKKLKNLLNTDYADLRDLLGLVENFSYQEMLSAATAYLPQYLSQAMPAVTKEQKSLVYCAMR